MTNHSVREHDAAGDEDRCKNIGNIVIGLHYLSGQARRANIPELTAAIDEVIASAAELGSGAYRAQLQKNSGESAFIENFCPVDDETVKYELREIVYKQSLSRKTGSF